MNTIFLATSPLHILISTIIASSMKKNDCTLIICGRAQDRNKEFAHLLLNWPDSPFTHTQSLKKAKRPKDFKHLIEKVKPKQIITGNDLTPEFFSIAHIAKIQGIELAYMDDGLHSYIEYRKCLPHKLTFSLYNIVRRISKGYTKPYPHTLGSSPLTKKAYLLFPNFVKDSIKSKHCYKITTDGHSKEILRSLGQFCINTMNLDMPKTKNIALFILPHHSRITIDVGNQFRAGLKHAIDQGMTTMIKNHPNNSDSVAKNITAFSTGRIYEIPKILPIEILICFNTPKFIIGGLSSIFLTTRALTQDIEFELICDDLALIPSQLSELFKFENNACRQVLIKN